MLRLGTSDNQIVEVEQYVLRHSSKINNYIENNGGQIPEIMNLPNIDSPTLRAIIEYYEHYRDDESFSDEAPPELSEFEKQFFGAYSNSLLQNLVTKSYEFGLTKLMNAACKHVANMIKGKSSEQLREIFELTPHSDDEEDDMKGRFLGRRAGQNDGAFREVQ